MLDIEIFYTDTPIYDKNKKVGSIPHLSLGTYAPLVKADKQVIHNFYEELSPAHRAIFSMMIHTLGQLFFASSLVHEIEANHNPFARQQMLNVLRAVYPRPFTNRESLLNKQDQVLHSLHTTFRPTHMVAMMIEMKHMHDTDVKEGKVLDIQDELFARGIAKCVQSIRDLPEKDKTVQIRRFCRRGTHRWKEIRYPAASM